MCSSSGGSRTARKSIIQIVRVDTKAITIQENFLIKTRPKGFVEGLVGEIEVSLCKHRGQWLARRSVIIENVDAIFSSILKVVCTHKRRKKRRL